MQYQQKGIFPVSHAVEGCLSKTGTIGENVRKCGGFFGFFLEKKEWIAGGTAEKGQKESVLPKAIRSF